MSWPGQLHGYGDWLPRQPVIPIRSQKFSE